MSAESIYFENQDSSTLTLESVKRDFMDWRRDPNRAYFIPETVWDKIIALLPHYPKNTVLTSMRITNAQLTRQLKNRELAAASKTQPLNSPPPLTPTTHTPSFVKAIIPVNTNTATPAVFSVVWTKTNGSTMQVQNLSHDDVIKMALEFTR